MPESTILSLAGLLGMPIIQLLKGVLGLSGARMMWVTYILSFVIMLAAAVITNAFGGSIQSIFANPDAFLKAASVVFTATTLFYGSIKDTGKLSGK